MTGFIGQITDDSALRSAHGKGMKSKILVKETILYVSAKYYDEGFNPGSGHDGGSGV